MSPLYGAGGVGCLDSGFFWHFFLYKAGGSGGSTIQSGDQVLIMAWSRYLVVADWGGGSTVNVSSSNWFGPDETFTIYF